MTLNELKILLQMSLTDESLDKYLTMKLASGIEFVQRVCSDDFMKNGEVLIPALVKDVVADYVAFELLGKGIQSESIAGMSQSFQSATERDVSLTNKLREAGYIQIKFFPLGRKR